MLATFTNLSATDPVDVPHPLNETLAESAVVVRGISSEDLLFGHDKGDPAYKKLNKLIYEKKITVSIAADGQDRGVLDLADLL